ncbi:hypothetical protein [Leptospira santarosai]|uniref:hypothetical protein n=1 Tax=Leptospira santarosai TaxID=28183 RepID=UPI000363A4AC|nr:hypothetical protein [Leptospira santarosai]MDI7212816.1 hypothetical protein [Leptospira santarosai]MDI7221030.1 hypothetical protein [Leptospira santarosai]
MASWKKNQVKAVQIQDSTKKIENLTFNDRSTNSRYTINDAVKIKLSNSVENNPVYILIKGKYIIRGIIINSDI